MKAYSREATRPDWFFPDVVTISGESGVGTTETFNALREHYGENTAWKYVSGGEIFRGFGKERGMKVEKFARYARENTQEGWDRKCDEEIQKRASGNRSLTESRLSHIFVPHGFHVLIICPTHICAKRRMQNPDYKGLRTSQIKELIEKRDEDDRTRYEALYPGCLWAPLDFDLVRSTEIYSTKEIVTTILEKHSQWRHRNEKKIKRTAA
ncbi:hypothetical protein H0W91_00050 [Patescibacteria group bacterium]|nr:hypothetical protein [Patescibacteria group bacterium]